MNESDEQSIFCRALEIEDQDQRDRFIVSECRGDNDLESRVRRLLALEQRAREFMDDDPMELGTLETVIDTCGDLEGTTIDRYKLLEQIGEGGMGVVYMAEQTEPVRRKVALKIIKLGMDTKQVVARFEAERQALALMDHPNIAKVLDGGATDTGRPYFVMELVRGEPITKFCQSQKLDLKERLELFRQVCEAVQHAHQKGIIHRDIKPSNVLVSLDYGKPTPKVIDFGVAKATNQKLTERTLFTQFAQMIGTPAYMSPEQSEMTSLDVDTRTDVYSLGVLLYELLTDSTPFSEENLRSVSYDEMRRIIREDEPERPSTRVTREVKRSSSSIANHQSKIENDLDWIVMKALDKDRRRRYDTPKELAEDLENYLKGKPVQASPPSKVYRARKFVRRHRLLVSASTLAVVAVIFGITLALLGYVRAEREAGNAKAVLNFLSDDLLALADPYRAAEQRVSPDREIQLREAIRQAALRIGDRFKEQPLVEAEIRMRIGEGFLNLEDLEDAETQLLRSEELFQLHAGKNDRKTLKAQELIGRLRLEQGKRSDAITILKETLNRRKQILHKYDPDVFSSMNALASAYASESEGYVEAESLYLQVIELATQSRGELDVAVLAAKAGLSRVYYETGLDTKSRQLDRDLRQAIQQRLAPDHPEAIRAAIDEVFDLRYRNFDIIAAANLSRGLFEKARRVLGDTDPHTLHILRELNEQDQRRGLWGNSIARQRQLLGQLKQLLPLDHKSVLHHEDVLGGFYFWFGDSRKAVEVHRDTIVHRLENSSPDTIVETRSQRYLSMNLFRLGDFDEAERLYRDVIQKSVESLGPESSRTIYNNRVLLRMLVAQGKWPEATALFLSLSQPSIELVAESENLLGHLPVHTSFLAASMAMNDEATRELLDLVLDFGNSSESERVQREIARYGLMLNFAKLDDEQRAQLIDFGERSGAHDKSTGDRLLSAAVSYRSGRYQEALDFLGTLPNNPENSIAANAGLLAAMAHHQLGEKAASLESLNKAQRRVDLLLRPGLLEHKVKQDARYVLHWADNVACLLLRREAESLILEKLDSPRVDETFLANARLEWAPIQMRLEEMEMVELPKLGHRVR